MRGSSKNAVRFGFVFGVVFLLAVSITAGSAAADHSGLAGVDGEGTEDDPYVITDVHELQAIDQDLEAHYVLGSDIDASETSTWEAGAGFSPIGDEDDRFTGSFDGNGHTIEGLHIDRPGTTHVGLFGYTFDTTIEDVTLEAASVTGGEESSAFVGFNTGDIRDVTVSGEVHGTNERLGGVAGYNGGEITDSAFVGSVEGTGDRVGGLIGVNTGPVDASYTVATVEGREGVGGLIGSNSGPVRAAFATGSVTGTNTVGGFSGYNSDAVNDVYSTANVSGTEVIGGLIASNSGTVTSAYTTGTVNGSDHYAGLMAGNSGITRNVYWNVQTSGHADPYTNDDGDDSDVVGLESDELTGDDAAESTELDFGSVWQTSDGYPRLQWEADRDVPDDAYDVITEPVELDADEESTEAADESTATSDDRQRDEEDVFGIPGFGVVPAATALLAVALIGYRRR